jgi:hypothetical protein
MRQEPGTASRKPWQAGTRASWRMRLGLNLIILTRPPVHSRLDP